MTTIAYDGNFIVSDSHFTNIDGVTGYLEGAYKLRVIGELVLAQAGNLASFNVLSDAIASWYLTKNPEDELTLPVSLLLELDTDFELLIYYKNQCLKLTVECGKFVYTDMTTQSFVIGSGKNNITEIDPLHSNAFHQVAEGIKNDLYSGGELFYVYLPNPIVNNLTLLNSNGNSPLDVIYHTANNTDNQESNMKEYQSLFKGHLNPGETIREAVERGCYPPPLRLSSDDTPLPKRALEKYENQIPLTEEEYVFITSYIWFKEQIRLTNQILKNNPGLKC